MEHYETVINQIFSETIPGSAKSMVKVRQITKVEFSKIIYASNFAKSRRQLPSPLPTPTIKSAIMAIFHFWQNGTFEPLHEIQFFCQGHSFGAL